MDDSAPGPAWLGFYSRQLWPFHFHLRLQRAAACNLWACENVSRYQMFTIRPTQTKERVWFKWPRWLQWQTSKLQITTKTVYPWWFFYIIPLSRWRHWLAADRFFTLLSKAVPRLHRGTFHHGFHKDFIREIPRVTNLVHFYVFWCLLTANLACNLLCQISWGCSAGSCTLSVEIRYVCFDSGETFGQNLASGKTAFSNHFCGCHQMEWRGV
jgi:hypothetical protein